MFTSILLLNGVYKGPRKGPPKTEKQKFNCKNETLRPGFEDRARGIRINLFWFPVFLCRWNLHCLMRQEMSWSAWCLMVQEPTMRTGFQKSVWFHHLGMMLERSARITSQWKGKQMYFFLNVWQKLSYLNMGEVVTIITKNALIN